MTNLDWRKAKRRKLGGAHGEFLGKQMSDGASITFSKWQGVWAVKCFMTTVQEGYVVNVKLRSGKVKKVRLKTLLAVRGDVLYFSYHKKGKDDYTLQGQSEG